MKICIPVQDTCGLNAAVEAHLPNAKNLLIFDSETRSYHYLAVNNPAPQPEENTQIHVMLCGSINRHALRSLIDQGITVYGTDALTALDAIKQFEQGELEAVEIASRHGHSAGGCGNHHKEGHECCGGNKDAAEHECCGGNPDKDHECCGGDCSTAHAAG